MLEHAVDRVCETHGKLVVTKLDRLGRSVRDVLRVFDRIDNAGATVDIIGLGDTATPLGRFMLTVMAAFAEMERELISERTREGLAPSTKTLGGVRTTQRADARPPGRRPSKHLDPRRQAIVRLLEAGVVSTSTIVTCLDPTLDATCAYVRSVRRERFGALRAADVKTSSA